MDTIAQIVLYLLIITPFLFLGKKVENWNKLFLVAFLTYFALDQILTILPLENENFNFIHLKMNWQGKINSYLLAFVFLVSFKKLPLSEYGLSLEQKEKSANFSFKALFGYTVFALLVCQFFGRYQSDLENILFQLTMPSIVEELVFRGILLGLLNQIFAKCWNWGKINFGMGVIITSILFGLWHGLSLTPDLYLQIDWLPLVYTGLIGFSLALVKERTGSILVPVIAHILINLIPNLMGYVY